MPSAYSAATAEAAFVLFVLFVLFVSFVSFVSFVVVFDRLFSRQAGMTNFRWLNSYVSFNLGKDARKCLPKPVFRLH